MNNQFGILAKYYDILNYNANYKKVADYIESVFAFYKKEPRLLLDLACGTGSLTIELAKRGYDMTGLDLSTDMLSVANSKNSEKKNKSQNKILWLNQDMCSFELYGTVDAVVCCFDSLNYILDEHELKKCFASVFNYLNPGGLFIFDVTSKYKFERIYANNNFVLEKKHVVCLWQNSYDVKQKICDFYLTIFAKQPDGNYKRYGEVQREKYYSAEFLMRTLTESGFENINIFYDFDSKHADITNIANITEITDAKKRGRLCFAAEKK